MKSEILDIKFDTFTFEESLNKIINFAKTEKNHLIFTPNPEMVMLARKNKNFKNILNSGDLVLPDGIGIVKMSKYADKKIEERVGGCDITLALLDYYKNSDKTVYILGGSRESCYQCSKNIEEKYGIKVSGMQDGYFKDKDISKILEDIGSKRPDILIIGLGMKKQEELAYKYKDKFNAKVTLCVGGTIDILSGKSLRAPKWYIDHNLEWFYRLIKNPTRFKRMLQLPLFVITVIKEKY